MTAPERIWAAPAFIDGEYLYSGGSWLARPPTEWEHVEAFVRADLYSTLAAKCEALERERDDAKLDAASLSGELAAAKGISADWERMCKAALSDPPREEGKT